MADLAVTAVLATLEDDESDENDDNDVIGALILTSTALLLKQQRSRIFGYAESVIPAYSDDEFRRMFRMSRPTFEALVNYLQNCPELHFEGNGGKDPISIEKQLYITLWYLGGIDTINNIADRFGVSESSVILCRSRVIKAILDHLKHRFITWPKDNIMQDVVHRFEQRNGFPGIVGALDGTNIKIRAPKDYAQAYVNRKKYHSIQLQAVCNADMVFTHCFSGFPGSCHDARVLRNSDLWNSGLQMCNNNHIIADGAYPLRRWLLTPYRDNGDVTPDQRYFNHLLSANRVVIERAFGLLKGRFRRLQNLETVLVETAVSIIITGCVLHNVCLMHHDEVDDVLLVDENLADNQRPIHVVDIQENDAEGVLKRNFIARNLALARR